MKCIIITSLFFIFLFPVENKPLIPDAISSETVINVKLNNGEKWQADEATTEHIKNLQALCKQQLSEKTIDDELLREELTREVDLLNRNTQMTGDARAQLHNYQLGIRNRINTISQDRESVQWLTDYLQRYFDYFE
tara:strand:+ start:52663 stop:53070 length:408 start_codon:yes stop_codon:yes gene_type:complete